MALIKPISQWSTTAKVIAGILVPTAIVGAYLAYRWWQKRKSATGDDQRTAEQPMGGGGGGGYYGGGETGTGYSTQPSSGSVVAPTGSYIPRIKPSTVVPSKGTVTTTVSRGGSGSSGSNSNQASTATAGRGTSNQAAAATSGRG